MQQEPVDYENKRVKRFIVRIVVAAWVLVPCAFVFMLLNASDRSSMQFPSVIIFAFSPFVAAGVTLVYWLHWR
jgi:hypothetical protein